MKNLEEYPNKCKRCFFFSRVYGNVHVQFCREADCYVEICRNCGTPEKGFRQYEVRGAVFD